MVTVDEAIIARYEKDGKRFEILVDPQLAYELKDGKTVSLSKLLAVNQIFSDAKKGMKASESDIRDMLGTDDIEKAAEIIIKKGELQLTTEFRKRKIEEKKKQIAAFISKYGINPQTKVPHPIERILTAMQQAHVNIDPFKKAEQQVENVVKAINDILPISIEETTIKVEIPAKYAAKSFGLLKTLGSLENQQWNKDGSLTVKIKFPSGMKEHVYHSLNSITEGEVKIIEE